jgi:cation:H+ antiporter
VSPLTANVLLLIGGCGVLYFGAEWLVRGAARFAASLGLHPIVVGLTVVSLGTSAPELVVCLVAAIGGNPDIAMGNVMGSNLANIGLILGLTALVRPLKVASRVVHREVPIMLLITLFLYPLILDERLGRADGAALLAVLVLYVVFVFRSGMREQPEILDQYEEFAVLSEHKSQKLRLPDVFLVVVGCVGLILGGYAIKESAVFMAQALGWSEMTIGLTVVAIGTSLPELATSVVAALRQEADIAVGNVIGSNIFNVAAILGVTASVAPLAITPTILTQEMPAVLLLSFVAWPVCRSGFRIQRWEGGLLLAFYLALTYWLVTGGRL